MSATAVIVPVEGADQAVLRWRREHTRDGAEGMPAHVTLLYPVVDDDQLVAAQVTGLREVLGKLHPFDLRFATFGQFDGPPRVLYLEPTPAQPLIHATRAIAQSWQPSTDTSNTPSPGHSPACADAAAAAAEPRH